MQPLVRKENGISVKLKLACLLHVLLLAAVSLYARPTNTFVVACYNVENWLLMERDGKPDRPKPDEEKDAVFAVLDSIRPDVLGLVEIGTSNDLAEVADGLERLGMQWPYREWLDASDPTRRVALLSRFPIAQRNSRTDYTYMMEGRSMRILRGVLDVTVQVNDGYSFRAIVVHLKSKVPSRIGDQAFMRLEEARLLRRHVDGVLEQDPQANVLVMGDLNDTPESAPIQAVIGEGPFRLFDLMPVAGNGAHDTHYWAARGQYSRIDYLLASPAMSNEFVEGSAQIADVPGWKDASDHRAIYARFLDRDVVAAPVAVAGPAARKVVYILLVVAAVIVVAGAVIVVFRKRPAAHTQPRH